MKTHAVEVHAWLTSTGYGMVADRLAHVVAASSPLFEHDIVHVVPVELESMRPFGKTRTVLEMLLVLVRDHATTVAFLVTITTRLCSTQPQPQGKPRNVSRQQKISPGAAAGAQAVSLLEEV